VLTRVVAGSDSPRLEKLFMDPDAFDVLDLDDNDATDIFGFFSQDNEEYLDTFPAETDSPSSPLDLLINAASMTSDPVRVCPRREPTASP